MPWSELFKSLFEALDGGFWGVLGTLGLLASIGFVFVPKERKLPAYGILAAVLVLIVFACVMIAKDVGPGQTRPSPSSSEFGRSIFARSTFPNSPIVFAQGAATGLKEWRGWLYLGPFDSRTGQLVSSQAYVEVIDPPNAGSVLPKIGYRLKLARSTDIYDAPPTFSALRLRWELGAKITVAPLPVGFFFEVVGECSVVLDRDAWCPILAKQVLVPEAGLLPDFPVRGSWVTLSRAYETRYTPAVLEIQKGSPNLVVVPQTDISLIFTRRVDKEAEASQAVLAMVGVGKETRMPVLGTGLMVGKSTRRDMIQTYKTPERERTVETESGRRLPCFAYPSRGISFVIDDKMSDTIVEIWIFERRSYEKFANLTC